MPRSRPSLPSSSRFAFCPEYAPRDRPQRICLVFEGEAGYWLTSLLAPDRDIAQDFCERLNLQAGAEPVAAQKLVRQSMSDARVLPAASSSPTKDAAIANTLTDFVERGQRAQQAICDEGA